MTSRTFSFFRTDQTISKYPARIFDVDYSIGSNANVVNFTITSNLTANTVLNYVFPGFLANDFIESNVGNVTLNSNGSATFTKTLTTRTNYSNTSISSYLKVTSYANSLIGYSDPITIAPISPINLSISGAEVTTANGNTIYKIVSNTTVIVNDKGDAPNAQSFYAIVIGGGGAGGPGYQDQTPQSFMHSGGGGGAGQVLQINSTVGTFFANSNSLSVTIGDGGISTYSVRANANILISNTDIANGQGKTTTFGSYTAIGGGFGFAQNGASGGGGGSYYNAANAIGIGSTGFNGGYKTSISRPDIVSFLFAGGGGGGANTAGSNATIVNSGITGNVAKGGNGGNAFVSSVLGYSVALAGGGGGGGYLPEDGNVAGLGGGGGAGQGGYGSDGNAPGRNATANTGSGGGGGAAGQQDSPPGPSEEQFPGGSGGSGVVYFAFASEIRKLISTANLTLTSPYSITALTIATNSNISVIPVSYSGGKAPYTFTIAPSLPTGAIFDTESARITGNVTSNVAQTTYIVSLTDGDNTTLNSNVKIAFSS
jgi:hypothetical protein